MREHKDIETFKCDTCDQEFYLLWRLQKHKQIHITKPKVCKYVAMKQECPYAKIGCMFGHIEEEPASKPSENEVMDVSLESEDNLFETVDEHQEENDNCHLCEELCDSQDDLINHLRSAHMDSFMTNFDNPGVSYAHSGRPDICVMMT